MPPDSISYYLFFKIFLGGACPQTPLEREHASHVLSALRALSFMIWPCNFTYGQSNSLLIGHPVQAIIYCYFVLCCIMYALWYSVTTSSFQYTFWALSHFDSCSAQHGITASGVSYTMAAPFDLPINHGTSK